VTELGSVAESWPGPARHSWNFLFLEFFFKRFVVSSWNFLFLEFSFKISVVSELDVQADWARLVFETARPGWSEFPVPRVFFQEICGFRAKISCSQRPPLYPDGQWLRTVAKYSTTRFCRELKSQSPVIPYPTTCLPAPPFKRRIFDG